jgi:hypothetical protein
MSYFKKLDFWSINDGMDEIMDYCYNGNTKDSQYWDYYSELINEMSCIASDLWIELQGMTNKFSNNLPWKDNDFYDEDACKKAEISWFNTAACMLSDIDMHELIDREGDWDIWNADDEHREKEKRIKSLERLTKKQQMYLYTTVIGFITRYLELRQAFDNIISLINELDYHQSFVINQNGDIEINKAAYL